MVPKFDHVDDFLVECLCVNFDVHLEGFFWSPGRWEHFLKRLYVELALKDCLCVRDTQFLIKFSVHSTHMLLIFFHSPVEVLDDLVDVGWDSLQCLISHLHITRQI